MVDVNTRERFDEIVDTLISEDNAPDDVSGIFSAWASQYDKDIVTHCFYGTPVIGARELASRLGDQKDARILDLGAGTGLVAMELRKQGFTNIDAFDASQGMLDVAKGKALYKHCFQGFLGPEPISIETGVYDALVCVGTFAPNLADDSCFEELIRITKPGGLMVFVVLHHYITKSAQLQSFELKLERLQSAGHWTLLNPGDIREGATSWKGKKAVVYVLRKKL